MAMRELLRVSMNERQVRQACEDWARSRSRADGAAASVIFLPADAANPDVTAEVIFTKKRERAPKKPNGQT
jgi:hypothetical protein